MYSQMIKESSAVQNKKNSIENVLEVKYADLKKCGVLYFEFNELDKISEKLGKETADRIFSKVSDSIHKLENENVTVYNCGLNGFLVVGIDFSKEKIRNLANEWITEWDILRQQFENDKLLSVGTAWACAPVSLKNLMVKAVQEMLYNRELIEDGLPLENCLRGEIFSSFGLLNRKQFFKNADYRIENTDEKLCLIAVDIEHFKLFNEWYGRNAGDELLIDVAVVLKEFESKYNGIAAHFGGDDFAIIIPCNEKILSELESRLNNVIMSREKAAGFSPAFGVYLIDEADRDTIDMYDCAVEALSQVFGHYEKRVCFYDKRITGGLKKEIDIIATAREALKNNEFTIYLQPQVSINPVRIVGAEALVRWISPEKGIISPGEFIPVLEKNGFIGEVDQYVWEKVCITIRSWLDKGIEPVPVSINVSRIDILSFNTVEYLNELTKKYNIDRKYLKVEITESAYVDNGNQIASTIQGLREAGYMLMMDDFGSGYSSLNMLGKTLVDVIKLDMQFLAVDNGDIHRSISILKSVIDMSNDIQIPIVIEGVETEEQASFLKDIGVWFAQGYLYYKPMPTDKFEELISHDENVDRRGIYDKDIEVKSITPTIEEMLKKREERYKKSGISNARGGFLRYIADGSQRLLRVSKSVANIFGCETVEEFREYTGNSFKGVIHPDDRERIENEIAKQIKSSDWHMDYIEYRILRKDGEVRYVYDYGHLEYDPETGKNCFYVFLLDATNLQ